MPERLRTGGIVLVPALPVVALFIYWAAHGGGYEPTDWEPSALVVLGLLVATVAGLGFDRLRLTRRAAIGIAALAGYTAWSYLSISWAAAPGDALDGANRTLLFLLLFALFALLPWRAWTLFAVLSLLALGIGAIAAVDLLRLSDASAVEGMFLGGRLKTPLGYPNGGAALLMIGTLLSTALASRRELPAPLRAVLLASAAVSLQMTVLTESRGWLFALPIVAIGAIVLVPGRVRLVLWMAPVALASLIPLRTLLDVFSRPDGVQDPDEKLQQLVAAAGHAHDVVLPVIAVVFVAGLAMALLDRSVSVSETATRRVNEVAAGLAVIAVIAGIVAGFAFSDGRPDRKISDYWDRSSGYQATTAGSSRFSSVGSNRPDFWRVSLDAFAAHPLGGLGQDNWGDYYLQHRRSAEQPRWTHSIELRLLAHTGVVGTLLFAVFLVATLLAALRGRRRAGMATSAAAAIALLPLLVWFVHGSIDWFWEFPALSGPAFAFLGAATAVMAESPSRAGMRSGQRIGATVAIGVAAVLALLALGLPYAAERETAEAAREWPSDPAAALRELDRAANLNPLSARTPLVAGVIALEANRPNVARQRFAQAVDRSSGDWFGHFGLALAATATGERRLAATNLAAAHSLSPDDPLISEAIERLDSRRPLTYTEAFARLRDDVATLTGTR
ncbi:O-antigen ligase family protein [Conexibacter sp. CPCC 206217]|uniref:O-antigen ligase family protein n=1 Tax=Conexibacter sp. CPCC 206217 TaxID=3064574 RepID=UPI00271E33F2|nr:O-antigen ligase family protein [Conexibacter sp. CPCC 206217]MDO8209838.1 O-antigen ligase family protein [Conexibacter sp. CPCC 206217]